MGTGQFLRCYPISYVLMPFLLLYQSNTSIVRVWKTWISSKTKNENFTWALFLMSCKCRHRWQLWDYVSAKRTNEWLNWWIRMSFEISLESHFVRGKGNRLMGGDGRQSETELNASFEKYSQCPAKTGSRSPPKGILNQHGRKLWRLKESKSLSMWEIWAHFVQ